MAAVSASATTVSATYAGYLGLLTAVAWFAPPASPPPGRCETRFALLIPAHNEELLITESLAALGRLDYPPDLVAVHVVADHCSDATAELARAAGAVVHEHLDPRPQGKGSALSWAFGQIGTAADAIVIVDADTLVDGDFLRVLDAHFAAGAVVVQANYSVLTPEVSSAIALRFAALAIRHHLRPLGRVGIGASSGLFGNGMAFRGDVLETVTVSDHLTEDLELACLLVLEGIPIGYAPTALVGAEMPATLNGSGAQHERWERGRIDVARRFVSPLVRSAFGRGVTRRRARIDAAADLVVPPLSVTVAGSCVSTALALIGLAEHRSRLRIANAVLASAGSVVVATHVLAALRLVRAPGVVYRSLAEAPWAIGWKALLWARMLFGRGDVRWSRTARNEPFD